MAIDLDRVMEEEREWLFAEALLLDGHFPLAAVAEVADIRAPSLSRVPAGSLAPLSAATAQHALVQTIPGIAWQGRPYCFLWTHVAAGKHGTRKYRDYYIEYLERCRGQSGTLPSDHEVDHLYSEDRAAKLGLVWIRMALLPEGLNASHGAAIEKSRGKAVDSGADGSAVYFGTAGRPRHIDWITLMKLFLVRSPRKRQPLAGRADVQAFALEMGAKLGVEPAEVLRGIEELRRVAAELDARNRRLAGA